MSKQRWIIAVMGSLILHCIVLIGLYFVFANEAVTEPVYMEVSLSELFQPQAEVFQENMTIDQASQQHPPSAQSEPPEQANHSQASVQTNDISGPVQPGPGQNSTSDATNVASGVNLAAKSVGTSRSPRVVYSKEPVYPEQARMNGHKGTVRLRFIVNKQGTVDGVILVESSGYKELDQAAIDCLKQWQFNPALKDGVPIAVIVTLPIVFDLK